MIHFKIMIVFLKKLKFRIIINLKTIIAKFNLKNKIKVLIHKFNLTNLFKIKN